MLVTFALLACLCTCGVECVERGVVGGCVSRGAGRGVMNVLALLCAVFFFFLAAVKTSSAQEGKGILGVCPAAKPQAQGDARPQCTFVPWPPPLVRAPPACAEERRACTVQDTNNNGRRATKAGGVDACVICL